MNYELERFTNLVNIADDQINLAEAALLFEIGRASCRERV